LRCSIGIAGSAPCFPPRRRWKHALEAGLIEDIPVAGESGGQVLPAGYHVEQVPSGQAYEPRPDWKLPRKIS